MTHTLTHEDYDDDSHSRQGQLIIRRKKEGEKEAAGLLRKDPFLQRKVGERERDEEIGGR